MEVHHKRPRNYLVESILVTIFCCLIFGIIGIVNAAKVNSEYEAGNIERAQASSKQARTWTIWGFVIGLLGYVILAFIYFILGVAAIGFGTSAT